MGRKHKIILLVSLVFVLNFVAGFYQKSKEGIHNFYYSKFINIDDSVYMYDPKTETILGTRNISFHGMINKLTRTFHGDVGVEGYELEGTLFSQELDGIEVILRADKNYGQIHFLSQIKGGGSKPSILCDKMYITYIMDDEMILFVYVLDQETDKGYEPVLTLIYADDEESAKACYQKYLEYSW